MDIQVARFREVLELLKPAVARKPTIESLGYIMLKDGQAVATNLETMVILPVREADITTLVPFKEVTKFLQFTPAREMLHVEAKSGEILLSWADGSASFPALGTDTFPNVPEFVPKAEETLNSDVLIPALVSVLPYAATETDRPILAGVTLILGDPIEVAAGDGFRMAHQVLPLSFSTKFTMILPANSVAVLKHLWEKTPRTPPPSDELVPILMAKKYVQVARDSKTGLRFQFEHKTTAIIKLVSGKPPDWLKLVPKDEPILQIQALGSDMELAVRRVAAVALQGAGMVRLAFEDGAATASASKDGQEVQSSFTILDSKGTPNRVALNATYLLEYLTGKQGIVSLTWTGNMSPVALHTRNEPRVLIMPMNVKDWKGQEEETPADQVEEPVEEPAEEEGEPALEASEE